MFTERSYINYTRIPRKEEFKIYRLYKHENITNKKVYIGITAKNPIIRWNEGDGYKNNVEFYSDIKKYGWDTGFTHEILLQDLSKEEAIIKECEYILKYDSVYFGYNERYVDKKSLLPENLLEEIKNRQIRDRHDVERKIFHAKEFDLYDFKIFNNTNLTYENTSEYFIKFPNIFARTNLKKVYGIHRIFLVVYLLIDRNRNLEDKSYISIGQIFDFCGYKKNRNKPKIFYEIIKSILFLVENNFIETSFDCCSIGYDDCIEIKIISDNFDAKENFTKIYGKDIDAIMMADTSLNRENILMAFLYINSYIGCRRKNNNGSEMDNAKDSPEAFWRSIESMAKELSMSKDTINQCIEYLISSTDERNALLVKREVGSVQPDKSKPPKNVPNIYVLNKEGYQQEIEWALSKMLEIYNVDEFYPSKNGNYRFGK